MQTPDPMTTINAINILIGAAIIFMGLYGFYEVVAKFVKKINERHDKEQAWDRAVSQIADERKKITDMYDERLDDLEAKMQNIVAEQYIIMETQQAILDGLGQLKCNGPVTEQKKKIDNVFIKFLPWLAPKISKDLEIAKRQIRQYEVIYKSWDEIMFDFMNEVVTNIVVLPATKLQTTCPTCGEEVTSDIRFPNGINDLFNISGGRKKFGKK